jgi:hypothetical protein
MKCAGKSVALSGFFRIRANLAVPKALWQEVLSLETRTVAPDTVEYESCTVVIDAL